MREYTPHRSALPFVLRREQGVVTLASVTSTVDKLHGLLRLDGEHLVVQWRAVREISRVGLEIRTDHEMTPVREVSIPLDGLAGARVRRAWRRWWFRDVIVLNAADLQAFDVLAEDQNAPGLVLEHPAEVVLEIRREDRSLARDFAADLRLALSERLLASLEEAEEAPLPGISEGSRLPEESPPSVEAGPARTGATRTR